MEDKYEKLLERSVTAQETSNQVVRELGKVAGRIEQSTTKLNDGFILHQQEMKTVSKDVSETRQELIKWIKWLTIALLLAVGGSAIVDKLGLL